MKVTGIKQQVKQSNRYSIYVDGTYSFSLSEQTLLDSQLVSGTELDAAKIADYKKLSTDDKLYNRALRHIALRPRSTWEIEFYLARKDAAPQVVESIVNKLSDLNLLNDEKFAATFVRDRRLLRSMSRRRLHLELQKKRVPTEIIDKVLREEIGDDTAVIASVIQKKRRQSKYQDQTKLMQYLARQGFNYSDIKTALAMEATE